ncbi:MAG: 2-oxoacid:acceptor oxidoreductase family protein [Oscillospiraceae bacterium]|nr:2-oxoacid:acceptor oxidoreductase family protein [Oscillospiraceae bacterium]
MNYDILLAGFGGQGILFAGKVLAYSGLMDSKEVSWLPSYGPEMRGGTCNCSVCISDEPIGSPLVVNPNVLVAMNTPSLEKFIDTVQPGGTVIVDSSMVDIKVERTDVKVCYVPATELTSTDPQLKGGANIILTGKLLAETGMFTVDTIKKAFEKIVPAKKAFLIDNNLKAIQIGMDYNG